MHNWQILIVIILRTFSEAVLEPLLCSQPASMQ
jgi:hypothetical protein